MPGDVWFSPREINFSKFQLVSFLLPNLPYIRDGIWPPSGKTTGYTEISNKPCYRAGAAFEAIVGIAAEIDIRMALIGKLSEILELIYTLDEEPLQVARDYRMSEEDLSYHCRKMLKFMSGWRRKRETYQDWLRFSNIRRLAMAIG